MTDLDTEERRPAAVIGLDVGGTSTDGVLLTPDGSVVAVQRGGGANYQGVGADRARLVLDEVLVGLRARAEAAGLEVRAAGFGIAGLDRPRDEEVILEILGDVHPIDIPYDVVNDTYLILRAGTTDGVGVAVVAGTGSNCVGTGPDGRAARVGGFSWEFGDSSSATEIGTAGLRAAFRGQDGRGPATTLADILMERLDLQRLDDLVDLFTSDASATAGAAAFAPLVFEAADAGDDVADAILHEAGADLGLSARIVASRLFASAEPVPLVMGGSVLQKGRCDTMRRAIVDAVTTAYSRTEPRVLRAPPVLGACLLALDLLHRLDPDEFAGPWPDTDAIARAEVTLIDGALS